MNRGASVILLSKDNKVLLNLRDSNPIYYKDKWSIIGGGMEEGEDPETTARRELLEETGYKANIINFLTKSEYIHENGQPAIGYIFWAEYDGKQEVGCFEGLKMEWVEEEKVSNLSLITRQAELIKLAFAEHKKSNNN